MASQSGRYGMEAFVGLLLGGFVVMAVLIFSARLLMRRVGNICHQCASSLSSFHELTTNEQAEILEYFRQHEKQMPDKSSIFACKNCLIISDYYSGEKTSCKVCNTPRVGYLGEYRHSGELEQFRRKNPHWIAKVECLRCERSTLGGGGCLFCKTEIKVKGCRRCNTIYAWMPITDSGFKYLITLTDKQELTQGGDYTVNL